MVKRQLVSIRSKFSIEYWDVKWRSIIKAYAEGSTWIALSADGSHIWVKYTQREEQFDENLMQAGIFGIR